MPVSTPTIHTNGSNPDRLIEAIMTARTALMSAMRAMDDVCPNGRDYYPQGPNAIQEALRQHANRLHNLEAVNRELAEIAEAIDTTRA